MTKKTWQYEQERKTMDMIDEALGLEGDAIDALIQQEDRDKDDWYEGEQAHEYYRKDGVILASADFEDMGW